MASLVGISLGARASCPPAEAEPAWQDWRVTEAEREQALSQAVAAVAAGECIVMPTDTVYGIAADASNPAAVQRLLEAKHRGRDMPPPVLIAEPELLPAIAADVPWYARLLAEQLWPGALTLILTAPRGLRMDLGETAGTIAVRVPDHDLARELLRRTGPLAVSSANTSGLPPATTVDDARRMLSDSVSVYLDDGPTPGETPSTIIDFATTSLGRVLRLGAIGLERLRQTVPYLEVAGEPGQETRSLTRIVGGMTQTLGSQLERDAATDGQ